MNKQKLQQIIASVAEVFGLSPDDVLSGRRERPYPQARWAVFWKLRRRGLSNSEIGRICGVSRDSVGRGIVRFEDELFLKDQRCLAAARD